MTYNKNQKDAISSINGPVMVISCAGSGKTSVIIERTNRIVQSGVLPTSILVTTFSRAAANEMKEKYVTKFHNSDVNFSTIHALCFKVLTHSKGIGIDSVLKPHEKNQFFWDTYMRMRNSHKDDFDERYDDYDEFYKDMDLKLSHYAVCKYRAPFDKDYNQDILNDSFVKSIYGDYIKYKIKIKKIDFNDMIIQCHKYFAEHREILEQWRKRYEYIMIDEFQDTNILQAEIFFMLADEHENICVVGDDDQSIYSFRGADGIIFDKFLKQYPNAKKIFLQINYRSRPEIINSASNLIGCNSARIDKTFYAHRTEHCNIAVERFIGNTGQVDRIVAMIEDYREKGVTLSSIAILYRIKKEARLLSSRLQREKIPFYTNELPPDVYTGMVFQDISSYYRLANGLWNPSDLSRIINRPARYINANILAGCPPYRDEVMKRCLQSDTRDYRKEKLFNTVNRLFDDLAALRGRKPIDFMNYLLNVINYRTGLEGFAKYMKTESRLYTDDFDELMKESEGFASMQEWREYAESHTETLREKLEDSRNKGVWLGTFHAAKGLEWNNVIIISANDGITPAKRSDNSEEERRLFYVAVTRAKDELSIFSIKDSQPSVYIDEMKING